MSHASFIAVPPAFLLMKHPSRSASASRRLKSATISDIGRWATSSVLPHPTAWAEVVVGLRRLLAGDDGDFPLHRLALQESGRYGADVVSWE